MPRRNWSRGEPALCVHEVGDFGRRQHGGAFDHHQMQPDAQVRHGARAAHGIGGGGAGHHQAGGVQDAGAVGALDRLVDRLGQAEIVGGEQDHGRTSALLSLSCAEMPPRLPLAIIFHALVERQISRSPASPAVQRSPRSMVPARSMTESTAPRNSRSRADGQGNSAARSLRSAFTATLSHVAYNRAYAARLALGVSVAECGPCLDLRLFIDAGHQGTLRWVEVKAVHSLVSPGDVDFLQWPPAHLDAADIGHDLGYELSNRRPPRHVRHHGDLGVQP